MRTYSATPRRLFGAFGSLVGLFAVASFIVLDGVHETHHLAHLVKRQDAASRHAIDLGIAVRDQYAHVVHAILGGGAAPTEAEVHARSRAEALAATLSREVTTSEQRGSLSAILRTSEELDALASGVQQMDQAGRSAAYADARRKVAAVQPQVEHLAASFGLAIDRFDEHAGLVQHSSFLWTVGALSASIFFAIVIGLYIHRSIAKPIARLTDGAVRIGGGDLTTRIEGADRADEFGRLAEQFNRMTAALSENQARIVESEKLAGIGRLAAGVAHEINNPLAVILGYARVLARGAQGQLLDDLKIIEDETLRCKEIVEGLLNLARPQKVRSDAVPLRELCENVARRLRQSELLAGVNLAIEGNATICGSADGVRQILVNLLTNAAQATGATGEILIRIERVLGDACVSISDTGPGLANVDRGRLFEPFFTTRPTGTGLGLAVSRSIARGHGGDLTAQLSAPGATFVLRLPLHAGREA